EAGAVTVENFKAVVNPEKCTGCNKCVEACPQGCISSFIV
ncbi:MAG: ferredoxin, partial [Ruminococcaceae bacterium]|nr:ferredoxin [Oscillospiraceae bacterium]